MKYLCLVYLEQEKMDALTPSELAKVQDDSRTYDEDLQRSGHLIAAQALEPVKTATTVRVRGGKRLVIDGPFAETKEHLGGFILINARSRKDAVAVAAKIPLAKIGSIEVRPIMEF